MLLKISQKLASATKMGKIEAHEKSDTYYISREDHAFFREPYDERVCSNAGQYRGVGQAGKVGSHEESKRAKKAAS